MAEQSAGRRIGVATVDQAISGASNVLIAILAARVLGVESFGRFGIVFLVYVIVQGAARALVGEPLLLHPAEAEQKPGEMIGSGICLGLGLGLLVAVAGLLAHVWDARLGNALTALGVFLPLLVLQDLGRYLGFATRRPSSALTLDVTWLLLQLGAITGLVAIDADALWEFIAAWAGSGAVAGLLVFWQHRRSPIRVRLTWLTSAWSYSWRYLVSYTSTQGSGLLAAILLGAIAGAKALGAVQGALLLQRPFMTVQAAVIASSVGEISRRFTERDFVRAMVRRLTILTTGVALVNGIILLLVPDAVGRAFLGDTWAEAEQLLWPTAAQILLLGLVTGLRTGVLGLRRVDRAVVIDIVTTVLALVLSVIGAIIGGAEAALWGTVISNAVGFVIWAVVFSRISRADEAASTPSGPPS